MVTKYCWPLAVGTVTCLLLLTACPSPCIEAVYSFEVTASYKPDKDSITIGDTLYLESSFPAKLFDSQTKSEVDYSNAKTIGATIAFGNIAKAGFGTDSTLNDFAFVSFKGQIYNDPGVPGHISVNQIQYADMDGKYILKVGIIPKKKVIISLESEML